MYSWTVGKADRHLLPSETYISIEVNSFGAIRMRFAMWPFHKEAPLLSFYPLRLIYSSRTDTDTKFKFGLHVLFDKRDQQFSQSRSEMRRD